MALIDDLKIHLRIDATDNDLNTEITDLINAALADLGLGDLTLLDPTDALIKMAIITYVKLNFGYEDVDSTERLQRAYESIKKQLNVSGKYTV